jgi:hypothetical protein
MPPPRKNPPKDAADTIRQLTEKGISNVGIAMQFKVSKETLKRWLDDYPQLQEAFEQGREVERQALHAAVYRSAIEGKPANVNAFFLLKARFGYVEADNRKGSVDVNVDVKLQSVLVVRDHGSDEEWRAKSAAQQANLVLNAGSPPRIPQTLELEAPKPAHVAPMEEVYPPWYPKALRKAVAPPLPVSAPECIAGNGSQPPTPCAPPSWRQNS